MMKLRMMMSSALQNRGLTVQRTLQICLPRGGNIQGSLGKAGVPELARTSKRCADNRPVLLNARSEASGMVPIVFLETLAECMEEDFIDEQCQPVGPSLHNFPDTSDEETDADSAVEAAGEEPPVFEVRLFKRDGVQFGIAFNTLTDGLLITAVLENGLADIWNRMCLAGQMLRVGDKVVACRGCMDPELMLQEFFNGSGAFRLIVRRGPFEPQLAETFMPLASSSGQDCEVLLDDSAHDGREDDARAELERTRQLETKEREEAIKRVPLTIHEELQAMIAERFATV